jgi:hypothetical protein
LATGTTTVDFGSGATQTNDTTKTVTITGQGSIVADSLVEAWIRPVVSADHSVDEHMIEALEVRAGNIVAGTGFDIVVHCILGKTHGVWNLNWAWV